MKVFPFHPVDDKARVQGAIEEEFGLASGDFNFQSRMNDIQSVTTALKA